MSFAFCVWDGGRLPTEAEFNYAQMTSANQLYPWGSVPLDHAHAVYGCSQTDAGCTAADIPNVGSRSPLGDGQWGHSDLLRSAHEWVLDAFLPYAVPCVDCAALWDAAADRRVKRGGSWDKNTWVETSGRDSDQPQLNHVGQGFRCAR